MSLSVYKGRVRTASLSALCFAACLILNLVWPFGCLAADASRGGWRTVRIASEGARPPYNYLENNKLAGFEIDLARDLCVRMKVSC
ncbi:MAG: transporter substrate-binding domain-containing protein, partial [Methylocella sp.]